MAKRDPNDPKLEEKEDWWFSLSSGLTDSEIAAKFGVTLEQAKAARDAVHANQVAHLALPVGDQYAAYRTKMEGVVRRLAQVHDVAMKPGKGRKVQLKTAQDAATAMARVIDRTVERGQELGVLPKAVTQKKTSVSVSGGVMVAAMTGQELAARIAELAKDGRRLREEYASGVPFTSLPQPDIYSNDPGEAEELEPEPARVNRRKH